MRIVPLCLGLEWAPFKIFVGRDTYLFKRKSSMVCEIRRVGAVSGSASRRTRGVMKQKRRERSCRGIWAQVSSFDGIWPGEGGGQGDLSDHYMGLRNHGKGVC